MPYADKASEAAKQCAIKSSRRWRTKNPEKAKASAKITNRRQYLKNCEERKQAQRDYRAKNLEKVRAANRAWRSNNPEKALLSDKRKRARWRATDPARRLLFNMRSRLGHLMQPGVKKVATTRELIGCSVEYLWQHLAGRFKAGMSRDNYGKIWHVDHIIPCAAFDLTDPAQQRRCFHFSNLQPLFAKENIRKGSRLPTRQLQLV